MERNTAPVGQECVIDTYLLKGIRESHSRFGLIRNQHVVDRYDAAGPKKTESLDIYNQAYSTTSNYDSNGQLSSFLYPDGTTYSDRGEPHSITHAGTTIDTLTYDDGGRKAASR